MKFLGIKIVIFINYIIFAMLLNSVGILIQKSLNVYGVDEIQASTLELFKDLSIALASFFVGSLLPKIGFKRGFLVGLLLVIIGCLMIYFGDSFFHVQLLFACIGVSFAVIKVGTYALIGNMSDTPDELNKFLSITESVFMVGIAAAYVLFPLFYSDTDPSAWLNIYLLISALLAIAFCIVLFTPFGKLGESVPTPLIEEFKAMLSLLKRPMVLIFAISAFLYVMMEQGIMSWLPTFNERVLNLPESLSVNMALILALSIAFGRFVSGYIVSYISWLRICLVCLLVAGLVVIFVLPQTTNASTGTINRLSDVPVMGFVFPMIGLFLAPLYPLMNSSVLGATEKVLHSPMAGLLTFFSALGGTLGSRIVGYLFKHIGGEKAFFFALIPMSILIFTLILLYRQVNKSNALTSSQ